ncbi:hypothetical protein [Erwinia phage Snitter]|nr:hypothetical protein [Erwinia phage Snitter]
MAKLIKESPFHKVWRAVDGNMFGFQGETFKYLVVDLRNGGSTALRTNSVLEACGWEPKFSPEEIMERSLLARIEEFSHKNTDFNRLDIMETSIKEWNKIAKEYGRTEFIINETFSRRQELANKFAEIYEAL